MKRSVSKLNSKLFLVLYLVVVVIILVLWMSRLDIAQPDRRVIPESLKPILISPPKALPQFILTTDSGGLLTNTSVMERWSFVYFTHPNCQPDCSIVYSVLENLKELFASQSTQFFLVNFMSSEKESVFSSSLSVYSAPKKVLQPVMASFNFLYIDPKDYGDTDKVEQQQYIYLIDPRGRAYAVFKPPFSSFFIQKQFFELRRFYALTE